VTLYFVELGGGFCGGRGGGGGGGVLGVESGVIAIILLEGAQASSDRTSEHRSMKIVVTLP